MIPGGALLVALFAQGTTRAPEATVPRARLEVRAASDCISKTDLAARVAARSPRIQFADDSTISAQIAVTSVRPGNVVAELVLGADGSEPVPRRFVARSCAEAADAVAVIIAVTLDPTARTDVKPEEVPPAPPPPPAPLESVVAPPPRPASPANRVFAAYVAGQTIFGPAPNVMPGISVYAMAALDRGGAWSPAVFVGATHVWRSGLSQPDGTASFTFDAASLDACPVRVGGARLAFRPCATALVGRLAASGSETGGAASAARPFAAAGAVVNAGVGIAGRVEVSLRVGVGVTLLRDAYEFAATTFHRAELVTTSASLGVGARW